MPYPNPFLFQEVTEFESLNSPRTLLLLSLQDLSDCQAIYYTAAMSKVLIVGEFGEIAFDLRAHLSLSHEVFCTTRLDSTSRLYLNLADKIFLPNLNIDDIDFAIFAAGITGELKCAESPENSELINVKNTIKTLNMLSSLAKRVYFISSSLCFEEPYLKYYDKSVYIQQKLKVENYIVNNHRNVFIMRPTKVIGSNNSRLIEWIGKAKTGSAIQVASNLKFAPVSSFMLANTIERHFSHSNKLFLHISSDCLETYSNVARMLFKKLEISAKLEEVLIENRYPQNSDGIIEESKSDLSSIDLIPESLDQVLDSFLSLFLGASNGP